MRVMALVVLLCAAAPSASVETVLPVPPKTDGRIPQEILASAREYVISRVGESFFESYMKWKPGRSCYLPVNPRNLADPDGCSPYLLVPRYRIAYDLHIPEKPWVHQTVWFFIYEDGGWVKDPTIQCGLPDCVAHPEECEFPIDGDDAKRIAEQAGLEAGLEDWRIGFIWWGAEYQTYVWQVHNTLTKRSGRTLVLDANTGEVLHVGEWVVNGSGQP